MKALAATLAASGLLLLASVAHAAPWPTGNPTGYFNLAAKGNPTLVCAEWRRERVINCKPSAAKLFPSWPPASATPVRRWSAAGRVCEQWNASTRAGKFVGLVVRCVAAAKPGALVAKWWIVDGSWGRA